MCIYMCSRGDREEKISTRKNDLKNAVAVDLWVIPLSEVKIVRGECAFQCKQNLQFHCKYFHA